MTLELREIQTLRCVSAYCWYRGTADSENSHNVEGGMNATRRGLLLLLLDIWVDGWQSGSVSGRLAREADLFFTHRGRLEDMLLFWEKRLMRDRNQGARRFYRGNERMTGSRIRCRECLLPEREVEGQKGRTRRGCDGGMLKLVVERNVFQDAAKECS
jgi:hypothetical protein